MFLTKFNPQCKLSGLRTDGQMSAGVCVYISVSSEGVISQWVECLEENSDDGVKSCQDEGVYVCTHVCV